MPFVGRGLAASNRAGITSGGLGGRRAPQIFFPGLTHPHTKGLPCFLKVLPVSRHLPHPANQASSSSCQRPQAGSLLRDCITVTRAKTTISSRSFAPNSKRENHVILLSAYLSFPRIPRLQPNAVHRQPYRRAFRNHLIVEAKSKITTKGSNSNNICNLDKEKTKEMVRLTDVPNILLLVFCLSKSLGRSARGLAWIKLILVAPPSGRAAV
jgi:hypothetical protein